MGDPFGVGADCIYPAVAFCFAAIPDENGGPLVVAFPFCETHHHLAVDWVTEASPLGFEVMPIDWLDDVRERMEQEGNELFLFAREAA